MSPTESPPIAVRIAHPEMLLALGVEAVLRKEAAFDARILADGSAHVPAASGHSSVLITDYHLGLQCAGNERTPGLPKTRVLVMSARDREHEIRSALEQGVQGYLPVACSPHELVAAVLSLARGQRYLAPAVAARMAESFGREAMTLREQEVLALLACGECNKSIARQLDIAIGTVKAHVKSIMHKLGASSRTKAICVANERGLIDSLETAS